MPSGSLRRRPWTPRLGGWLALDVGALFHCSLMAEIAEQFAAALAETTFHPPAMNVVSSVTATPMGDLAEAREVLRQQLTARVRWTETVARMAADGVRRFVEVGPGARALRAVPQDRA